MKQFVIQTNEEGQTLEKYLRHLLLSAPSSFIYKILRKKDVKINDRHQDRKYRLVNGDIVSVYISDEQYNDFILEKQYQPNNKIKAWIVYEDDQVIFVNKPRGLLVQKSQPNDESLDQLVVEYLMYQNQYDPSKSFSFKVGPAHRLDRNTSGIVIFGKTHQALQLLFKLFKDHDLINKHYLTLVVGNVNKDKDVIDVPLKKDEVSNNVFVASLQNGAKSAKTAFKVMKRYQDYSLLDVTLLTGRTHQIRVHMSYIDHPIVGDSKYGDFAVNRLFKQKYNFINQFLHAYQIGFGDLPSPLTHLSRKQFTAPIAKQYQDILDQLDKENSDNENNRKL